MDFSDADLDNSPSKPISKNSSTTSVPLKSSIKVRIFYDLLTQGRVLLSKNSEM